LLAPITQHLGDDKINSANILFFIGIQMKKTLQILDTILLLTSPIAILFFLIGAIMLPVELREHPNYLAALENGTTTEACVDYIYNDGDIHLIFADTDGEETYRILETAYYTPEVIATLQLDTTHIIRYVPNNYDVAPVLEEHIGQVYAYKQDLSGLYFILITSWVIIAIRPDFLYAGYVKNIDILFDRNLDTLQKGETA
jgi:hypothetical protein